MRLKLALNEPDGKKRKVLFLVDEDKTSNIADVAHLIKQKYFPRSSQVVLNLDGFHIPPQERISIIRENDTINVDHVSATLQTEDSSSSESEDEPKRKKAVLPRSNQQPPPVPPALSVAKPKTSALKTPASKSSAKITVKPTDIARKTPIVGGKSPSAGVGKSPIPLSKLAVKAAPSSSSSSEESSSSSSESDEVAKKKPTTTTTTTQGSNKKILLPKKSIVPTKKAVAPPKKDESSSSSGTSDSSDSSDDEKPQTVSSKKVVTKRPVKNTANEIKAKVEAIVGKGKKKETSSESSSSSSSSEEEEEDQKKKPLLKNTKIDFLISSDAKHPATSTPVVHNGKNTNINKNKNNTSNNNTFETTQQIKASPAKNRAKNMARKDVYKNTSQFIVSKQPGPSNAASPSGLSIPTINICDTTSDASHNAADSTNNDTVIEGGATTTLVASNGDSVSTNRNTRRNRRRKQKQQQNRNSKPNCGPVGDETYVGDGIPAPPAGGETITIDDTTINSTTANDTTANVGTVFTINETADVNGTTHLNGHDSQMVNGTTTCYENTSCPKDYSSYEVLWKPPPVGSMVAYKLLEMSTVDYTPHVSEYKEACVRNIEGSTVELHVKPTPKTCNNGYDGGEVVKGRFEMPTDDDEQENEASEESDVVTHDWCELIEPRLLVERFEF